uniref:Uncharacterized protein n=1 Tax=Arion vulgaris TaxID=1028688 RepID=A0A0B6ZK77_9EUPU
MYSINLLFDNMTDGKIMFHVYRMVTSSSEDVGCIATQSSNCALVPPILMATPKP